MVPGGLALTPIDSERRSPSIGPPADPGLDPGSTLTFPEVDGIEDTDYSTFGIWTISRIL